MARTINHLSVEVLVVMLLASLCMGQNTNATQPSQASAQTSPSAAATPPSSAKGHGVMPVELTSSLNSKKLKEGDPVMGRIAAELRMKDGTEIPRGSKVTGHVTEAKARSKDNPQSALGIIFDKISLPGGKDLAIKGALQAVAPNPNATPEASSGGVISPSMISQGAGAINTGPAMPSTPTITQPGAPILNEQSVGVLGIKGMDLGPDGVLTSSGKEVKVDSGTQMMVDVEIE